MAQQRNNMKHYKLTEETKVINSVLLYRIELTDDCKWGSKGEKGGWIEKEDNLYDNAWVSGNAKVYGDAQVSGNAKVYGDAQVSDDAWVYGNAHVYGGIGNFHHCKFKGQGIILIYVKKVILK